MKKNLTIIFLIGFFIIFYNFFIDNKKTNLGNGYYFYEGYDYWKSIGNTNGEIVPVEVIAYDYDANYIIAVRNVVELYKCYENGSTLIPQNNIALPVVTPSKLQYWLIDKDNDVAYITEKKAVMQKKLDSLKTKLKFESLLNNNRNNKFSKHPPTEYNCILENDPLKSKAIKDIINLDE
jgi:hypothetical protein